jgi:hypothetical protein
MREVQGPFGRGAYRRACQFCGGKGCFDCDVKSARACEESFNNPQVFKTDSPEDMARLKETFSADKLSTPEGLAAAIASFARPAKEDNEPSK